MSTPASGAGADARNRRASFRINDRVALRVRVLAESEYRAMRAQVRVEHGRQRQLNSILAAGESQRGALRGIREDDPALAGYLQGLEQRIEALVRLLSGDDPAAADAPNHDVNLSASGIRFRHPQALVRGVHVALALRLFPSLTCLDLLGTVVRVQALERGHFLLAVDFASMHDDDRELLIHHLHARQRAHAHRGLLRR